MKRITISIQIQPKILQILNNMVNYYGNMQIPSKQMKSYITEVLLMQEYSSCHIAIENCLKEKSFAIAKLYKEEKALAF